jgi:hypothetical protein
MREATTPPITLPSNPIEASDPIRLIKLGAAGWFLGRGAVAGPALRSPMP